MTIKHYGFILILLLSIGFLNLGCDSSSTGIKPVAIAPPTLVSPPDNATGVPLNATFTWTGTANKLEIASNPSFNPNSIIHSVNVTGGQYTIPVGILQSSTIYFWHAAQVTGGTFYWSESVFRFTTVAD
ncbi:MAG: Ig-like domain-containing protein [Ignavibacteria bacterium]